MPHLFLSAPQTRPEGVQPGQERGVQAPWPVAGGRPGGGCHTLNAQGISRGDGPAAGSGCQWVKEPPWGPPAGMWGPGGPG